MKKQFFRVKQLADQTFLRAEKSEIFNHEELQIADQRSEFLRSAISSITKKIAPSGPTNDVEKLMKKCFEYQLGTTFVEESKHHRECQLFQQVLKESGLIEQQLAKEFAEHEIKVEELVFTPLQNVLDNEFPSILKLKHTLRKYCLDKDSASSRYHATRKEGLREDMEEADTKVEQNRDVLATEMFNILAKENEFAEYVLQLLKLQRGYHESAIKTLETIIPQLEKKIGDSPVRRVFGTALKEHLRITGKRVAYPLEICVTALSEYGMQEEGLFRIVASVIKVKRLKSAIDSGCFSCLIPEYRDAHVLAGILKLYLRELPEPLLTFHLYKEWIEAMQHQENERLDIIKTIIEKLPLENRENLSYLIQFLSKLTQHPENKMSSSNIAIVLAPNLLWFKNEKDSMNIGNYVVINMLIELFIKEVDVLFPEDISKYVTVSKIFREEEMQNYSKMNSDSMDLIIESPRPNMRKKKFAPVPPNNENKCEQDKNPVKCISSSVAPPKSNPEAIKVNKSVNTDTISIGKESLNKMSSKSVQDEQENQNDDYVKYVCSRHPIEHSSRENIHMAKAVPEKKFKTVVSHPINQLDTKPVTASKQIVDDKCDKNKSVNPQSVPPSCDDQIRKKEVHSQLIKPEIPARPLSLSKKPPTDNDSLFRKTQCSLYNVADKLHPSIINIQARNDTPVPRNNIQIVERTQKDVKPREMDNKSYDVNLNCSNVDTNKLISPSDIILKNVNDSNKAKSNEQLNVNSDKSNLTNEKLGGPPKGNHVRARSDGGVIDIEKNNAGLIHVTSRSLNKPTEPPPPPP